MPLSVEEKRMDLIEAFKRTIDLLRSNLILFLPPLILAYLIPAALGLIEVGRKCQGT